MSLFKYFIETVTEGYWSFKDYESYLRISPNRVFTALEYLMQLPYICLITAPIVFPIWVVYALIWLFCRIVWESMQCK